MFQRWQEQQGQLLTEGSCFAALLGSKEQQLALVLPHCRSLHPQAIKMKSSQNRKAGLLSGTQHKQPLLHLTPNAHCTPNESLG